MLRDTVEIRRALSRAAGTHTTGSVTVPVDAVAGAAEAIRELEGKVIWGFYENEYPVYAHWPNVMELCTDVSADEVNRLVTHLAHAEMDRKLLEQAARILLESVRASAADSFGHPDCNLPYSWAAEDLEGYAAWQTLKDAVDVQAGSGRTRNTGELDRAEVEKHLIEIDALFQQVMRQATEDERRLTEDIRRSVVGIRSALGSTST